MCGIICVFGGGSTRDSKPLQAAQWVPIATGGFGFNLKVTRLVSLQLIPGEYVAQHYDSGVYNDVWTHNFQAKGGVVFNFYGNR